jgi:hypothetical protein
MCTGMWGGHVGMHVCAQASIALGEYPKTLPSLRGTETAAAPIPLGAAPTSLQTFADTEPQATFVIFED